MAHFIVGLSLFPRYSCWSVLLTMLVVTVNLMPRAAAISPALHEHFLLSIAFPRCAQKIICVYVRHSCVSTGLYSHTVFAARHPNTLVFLPRARACCAVISAVVDENDMSRLTPVSFEFLSQERPLVSLSLRSAIRLCRPSSEPGLPGWNRGRSKRRGSSINIHRMLVRAGFLTGSLLVLAALMWWYVTAFWPAQSATSFAAWPLVLCGRCEPLMFLLHPAQAKTPAAESMTCGDDGENMRPNGHFITLQNGGILTKEGRK